MSYRTANPPPPYMRELTNDNNYINTGGVTARGSMQPSMVYVEKKTRRCRFLGRIPWLSTLSLALGLGGIWMIAYGSELLYVRWATTFDGIKDIAPGLLDAKNAILISQCFGIGLLYVLLVGCFGACTGANREKCCTRCFPKWFGLSSIVIIMLVCIVIVLSLYLTSIVFILLGTVSATVRVGCSLVRDASDVIPVDIVKFNFTDTCLNAVHTINDLDWEAILEEIDVQIPTFNMSAFDELSFSFLFDEVESRLTAINITEFNFDLDWSIIFDQVEAKLTALNITNYNDDIEWSTILEDLEATLDSSTNASSLSENIDWTLVLDQLKSQLPSVNSSILREAIDGLLDELPFIDTLLDFDPGNFSYFIPDSVCTKWTTDPQTCNDVLDLFEGLDYMVLGSFCLFIGTTLSLIALGANFAHLWDFNYLYGDDKTQDQYSSYRF
ncbi:uncharacterized protein LOC142340735 [Convolutriloba macropyga]|uniref:uncharacterized protein LOC142340735 n=1 Tax=Convolutriloba macropyga TaxID=536237 RepID=UPI003F5245C8